MDKENYCIYRIVNLSNNTTYYGMTNDFERRKKEHYSKSYRAGERKKKLYKAMNTVDKYSDQDVESIFIIEKLIDGLSKKEAMYAEAFLINHSQSHYNRKREKHFLHWKQEIKKSNPKLIKELQEIINSVF